MHRLSGRRGISPGVSDERNYSARELRADAPPGRYTTKSMDTAVVTTSTIRLSGEYVGTYDNSAVRME